MRSHSGCHSGGGADMINGSCSPIYRVASLPGGVVVSAVKRVPPQAGAQGSCVSLWPLEPSRGTQGLRVI